MAISLILITLLIAGSLIAGSYTIYLPFFLNAQHNIQQTQTYYIARGALERGQLAIKYHPLWFAWSGWRQEDTQRWPISDNTITDSLSVTKLWRISVNQSGWNIDNKLFIHKPTYIYIWYDNTNNPAEYYQNIKNYVKYTLDTLSIDITIPTELKTHMWENNSLLCDLQDNVCDLNKDDIYDDIIIKRIRKWPDGRWDFTIVPYTTINREKFPPTVDYTYDTNIRESTINNQQTPTLLFSNTFNPLAQNHLPDTIISEHNMQWDTASGIQNQTFTQLLTNENIQYNIVWLNIVNPPIRRDSKIYPYLQYHINTDTKIATPMNTIQAYAEIDNTVVNMQTNKPSTLTKQKWSFNISNW